MLGYLQFLCTTKDKVYFQAELHRPSLGIVGMGETFGLERITKYGKYSKSIPALGAIAKRQEHPVHGFNIRFGTYFISYYHKCKGRMTSKTQ